VVVLRDLLTADHPDLRAIAAQTGRTLAYIVGWRVGWLGCLDDDALDCLTSITMTSCEVEAYTWGKHDGGQLCGVAVRKREQPE
jgi:hypothetical protein